MKKILNCSLILLVGGFGLTSCKMNNEKNLSKESTEIVTPRVLPFELRDIKLLDSPFKKATELNIKSLLNYEPDRLLAKFRREAGLIPKAEHYHGWEENTFAGHSLGHYLSACALMYQTTGDNQFLERVNYIVNELDSCQETDSMGYLGAIPGGKRILEDEVAKGNIRSAGFDLNGIRVPFYTYHKVMAGLRDAYHLCGNNKALEIEKKFADWIGTIVYDLPDSSIQNMLHCEHGGINEVFADLYRDTDIEKYLEISRIFHHKAILDSLLKGTDILPGQHANTQIPKLIGLARRYELTGDTSERKTAEYFWERVVYHHSYVTGGHCNYEHFGPPDRLRNRLSPNTTESCNVYNMLKLTSHIFKWNASVEAADFYERALFNHILASQHPLDGRVIYNLSLDMGGRKEYQDRNRFSCCVGTGMESHSKYGSDIYYHNNNSELYINQFIASELTWKKKGIVVTQHTGFPEEQGTSILFNCIRPAKLSVHIRYPHWAKNGIEVFLNGRKQTVTQQPGSYIALTRTWKNRDRIEIKIPFSLRLESMPDDSNRVAVLYGPLLLAGDLGPDDDPKVSDALYVPVFMTKDRDPANWTEPLQGRVNEFLTNGVGKPRDIQLRPFYKIHERYYTIYWDLFTPEQWKIKESDYQVQIARRKRIEQRTMDFVVPGNIPSEQTHQFKDENSHAGEYKGKTYRESRNSWFAYDLKIQPKKRIALVIEYWGGYPGAKTFDILVNNVVIATENISHIKNTRFTDLMHEIPEKLIRGKNRITVKFRAHENNTAGPVFGVRVILL